MRLASGTLSDDDWYQSSESVSLRLRRRRHHDKRSADHCGASGRCAGDGNYQLRTNEASNPDSMTVTVALKNHGVTVADTSTPLDLAGNPLFDAVWAYLCFQ